MSYCVSMYHKFFSGNILVCDKDNNKSKPVNLANLKHCKDGIAADLILRTLFWPKQAYILDFWAFNDEWTIDMFIFVLCLLSYGDHIQLGCFS